jgi:hypothetical protein
MARTSGLWRASWRLTEVRVYFCPFLEVRATDILSSSVEDVVISGLVARIGPACARAFTLRRTDERMSSRRFVMPRRMPRCSRGVVRVCLHGSSALR